MRKASEKEIIQRFINKHADKYDYSLITYINDHTKVKIICPIVDHGVECRKSINDNNILEVRCHKCNEWYHPTMKSVSHKIQALKGKDVGENNLYCSDDYKHTYRKSSGNITKPNKYNYNQVQFRQIILNEYGTTYERCGKEDVTVDVHHIIPLASCDIDILLWDNGMVVCKNCHHSKIHKNECNSNQLNRDIEC